MHKDAKLVIVTSPTYEGVVSDVEGICRAAHAYGVPVLVDSAHGAHFGFGRFPKGAVECGADLVVQSLHKTLPCLTQTAMLHRTGALVEKKAVQSAINMFQTSSPSYLLLASIEGCIGLLETKGAALFGDWEEALDGFYKETGKLRYMRVAGRVSADGGKGKSRGGTVPVFARDTSKIVICTCGTDLSGAVLMERLRKEYCIEAEMAAEQYVLSMTGMGDTKESLARLLQALLDIDAQCRTGEVRDMRYPDLPPVCMSAAEAEKVSAKEYGWKEAIGKIAGEYVWAYPPGIPLLVPGEEITEELVLFLLQKEAVGVRIHRTGGGNGEAICCLQM